MSKDWSPSRTKEEREAMMQMAKIARAISILSVSLTNSMLVAYVSMGVGKKKFEDLRNKQNIWLLCFHEKMW